MNCSELSYSHDDQIKKFKTRSTSHNSLTCNGRGKPTASSLSAIGFPLMAGSNFQPLDGNPNVISILRQLANGLENVPEM